MDVTQFLSSGLAPLDQGDAMEQVEFVEQVMDDAKEGSKDTWMIIWVHDKYTAM
uniref:Uncharacterized protein n=1 Tax=Aegilops tauschii TaxID=37682 RepID=M8CZ82_AEGTA